MKHLLILCAIVLLAACTRQAEQVTSSSNPEVPIDTLFRKDGCTMYRFIDAGHYRYFARCDNGQTSVQSQNSCGKNCTRHVEIPTYER